MDPDQGRKEAIGGITPSVARRPRVKPMHIPGEVGIDYESRAKPNGQWGLAEEGFSGRESSVL